jgi:hypothetical protein
MEQQQQPLKLRIGVEFTIFKHKGADELDNMDCLNEEEKTRPSDIIHNINMLYKDEANHIYFQLNTSTTNISVYTPETMKEIILSL